MSHGRAAGQRRLRGGEIHAIKEVFLQASTRSSGSLRSRLSCVRPLQKAAAPHPTPRTSLSPRARRLQGGARGSCSSTVRHRPARLPAPCLHRESSSAKNVDHLPQSGGAAAAEQVEDLVHILVRPLVLLSPCQRPTPAAAAAAAGSPERGSCRPAPPSSNLQCAHPSSTAPAASRRSGSSRASARRAGARRASCQEARGQAARRQTCRSDSG